VAQGKQAFRVPTLVGPFTTGKNPTRVGTLNTCNQLLPIQNTASPRPNPFTYRNRHPIPDHSVSIITAPRENECVRNSLQPGVFSNRIRPHAVRKPSVRHQSRAQVFGVMRHASGCNVPALGVADNRAITILAGKSPAHIVRDVRRRIGLEYFC
jgi:hypothetical protein